MEALGDCAPFYYHRADSGSSMNIQELDPPRTRIAVACNRCRRRKIKCSGCINGGSCEGCTRANQVECVFADRPAPTKLSYSHHDSPSASNYGIQLQPPANNLTSQSTCNDLIKAIPRRANSMVSVDSHDRSAHGSPQMTASTPSLLKRHSNNTASHPYQRPGAPGARKNSGEQMSSTLLRYSQSLVQSQAMQLSGRPARPMSQSRQASITAPTSFPHAVVHSNISNAPFQLQPPLAHSPTFRPSQNYMSQSKAASGPSLTQQPSFVSSSSSLSFFSGTPETTAYSPVYQSDMYAAGTPELISSDSINTIASMSSFGDTGHGGLMQQQQLQQQQPMYAKHFAYMNVDYTPQPQQSNMPLFDPTQWTPGVDKIANQWLQFSPQRNEQFF